MIFPIYLIYVCVLGYMDLFMRISYVTSLIDFSIYGRNLHIKHSVVLENVYFATTAYIMCIYMILV